MRRIKTNERRGEPGDWFPSPQGYNIRRRKGAAIMYKVKSVAIGFAIIVFFTLLPGMVEGIINLLLA